MKTKLIALIMFLFLASPSWAQESYNVSLDGKSLRYELSANNSTIDLYGVSIGNLSTRLKLTISALRGFRIQASARNVTGIQEKYWSNSSPSWYSVPALDIDKITNKSEKCVAIGFGEEEDKEVERAPKVKETNAEICNQFSDAEIKSYASTLSSLYGGTWNNAQVCGFIVNQAGGSSIDEDWFCANFSWDDLLKLGINCFPDFGFLRASKASNTFQRKDYRILLRKDSCSNKRDRYLVHIHIEFDKNTFGSEPTPVTISLREQRYTGTMEASIKPESDGRYKPQPIVLMQWLGNPCGSNIEVSKFSGKVPRQPSNLSIYSYYAWHEKILALALVNKVLTGGRGTFTQYNTENAYSTCFNLVRKRQKVNGYP